MTRDEKFQLVEGLPSAWTGYDVTPGYYVGTIRSIARLGVPALLFQDAQSGFRTLDVRTVGTVTAWPSMGALSAGWNVDLAREMGAAIGREFRAKGANGVLGPGVDVARVPSAGRNAESLCGEDGYLGAPLAREYIRGVQAQGVAAVVKHFVGNVQERNREQINVRIDERTLFEAHYPPFEGAIEADVASIMCSCEAAGLIRTVPLWRSVQADHH